MAKWSLRILDTPQDMDAVEELQRLAWPGSETEVIPVHMLITAAHNGGLVIGAYQPSPAEDEPQRLIGFVFGFVGLDATPDGPRPKHCSHMLAVHPNLRDQGLGFALKRAQWQMVRHQGLDHITWTYDPLMSRNAHLNIVKLGAVCNTYRREVYGEMRDGLPITLESEVDSGWFTRTQIEAIALRAASPGGVYALTLRNQTWSVMFRHQDAPAFEAKPLVSKTNPQPGDFYLATLKLMTV